MKKTITLLFTLLVTTSIGAQIEMLKVEKGSKKFELIIPDPFISIHFPTGIVYQDINAGDGFANLNEDVLRLADRPFGFQVQTENVIYSEVTKNSFSINHFTGSGGIISLGPPQRGYWGPRVLNNPFYYDLSTFGHIYSTEGDLYTEDGDIYTEVNSRKMSELTEDNEVGALKLYRYPNDIGFIHTLTIDNFGNPVWSAVSDKRAKENISNHSNLLSKVLGLQLKNYNYIGSEYITRGYIAQEVQELFPDLVTEMDGGMLGVNYMGFGVLAIQALKEQQKIIDSQEERIARLEQAILDKE